MSLGGTKRGGKKREEAVRLVAPLILTERKGEGGEGEEGGESHRLQGGGKGGLRCFPFFS